MGYLFYFLIVDHPLLRAYYEETINLDVCLSEKALRQLPEDIDQSISSYQTSDIDHKTTTPTQIAIRIGNDIFIDKKAYESLDAINKEYLQFHEVMHAFIPMETPACMTRLRDFVAGVRAIDRQIPQNDKGAFQYTLGLESSTLVRKLREQYELLKENCHVNVWPDEQTAAQSLVSRYVLLGDVPSLQVIFDRQHLQPMQEGVAGVPLFDELIFTLRECQTGDQRLSCRNALPLLHFFLDRGADPDMLFSTGEWKPMPAWEYLLFSMNRAGREPRLALARELFHELSQRARKSAGSRSNLQARLNRVLCELCRDNFLAPSADEVLRWGADVNTRDESGRTPLLIAVEKKGHGNNLFYGYPATHLIGVLMLHGADLSAKNAAGKTALEIMKDFKGPLRDIYQNGERYYLGIKALEAGPAGLEALRPEFQRLGMPLPAK